MKRAPVLLVALLLLAPAAGAQTPRASLPDIEDEVMCPICGTLLELSDAPQAERQRALIRRLIAEGRDKEEIKDALVAEYGEEVLAIPEDEGFDLAAWALPILGISAALLGLLLALRRVRRRDGPPREEQLDPSEASRLEADLRRYDL